MKSIYADSKSELSVKTVGLYHDHCYHYYKGLMDDLPKEYEEFYNKDYKYIFIYIEDTPIKE